jgi:hypothetical protein
MEEGGVLRLRRPAARSWGSMVALLRRGGSGVGEESRCSQFAVWKHTDSFVEFESQAFLGSLLPRKQGGITRF